MSGGSDRLTRKIRSAKDLSSVVRSMKALAASSVGQYERAVESLHDYTHAVELSLAVCLRESARGFEPPRRSLPAGVVIFGSDQGLVGRFNEVLMDFLRAQLAQLPNPVARVWAIGARMEQLTADAALPPATSVRVPNSVENITPVVGELLVQIEQARSAGTVDAIYLFHNAPLGGNAYDPHLTRLLPLDETWAAGLRAMKWTTHARPQVMDGPVAALPSLLRSYLFVMLFQACAESLASENASRLAAMQRAENNIADMLLSLTGAFHRLRQATIDEELFEVISGCEALGNP